jgi:hypothetical protein
VEGEERARRVPFSGESREQRGDEKARRETVEERKVLVA